MRPLPRILAFTDAAVLERDDFPVRAAAIASGGSAVGIVVRGIGLAPNQQLAWLDRVHALARPTEAAVFGHGDPALARLGHAVGVQLRGTDLSPTDARSVMPVGWIGVSVHEREEAARAFAEGADFVVAGNVFETPTHPDRPARGLEWLTSLTALGKPVFAIGGVTTERVGPVRAAGAWGVAAIGALFGATDPAAATFGFLEALSA